MQYILLDVHKNKWGKQLQGNIQ